MAAAAHGVPPSHQQVPLGSKAFEDKAALITSWLTVLQCFLFHTERAGGPGGHGWPE